MVNGRYHLTQAADADLERLYAWGALPALLPTNSNPE